MNNSTVYAASLFALVLIWRLQRNRSKPPYPPGPRGYPIIGNTLDIPRDVAMCEAFKSMAEKCDTDVLYLKLATVDFVVLTSSEAISDLFEKRSKIYSDRPSIPMNELMDGHLWNIGVMPYGREWKNGRKLLSEFMNPRAMVKFDDYQRKYAHRLLSYLAETPEGFFNHSKFTIAALTLEMTYGFNIESHEDKLLQATERASAHAEKAFVPGAFLVNTVPILKYVPEWFPGGGFKTFARAGLELFSIAVDSPLEYVKESLRLNGRNPSVASSCFDRVAELSGQGFDESVIRTVTGSMYTAAVDTTSTVLRGFFLAAALHPHVVREAQVALDKVIGNERLPDFSDEENLPYISALIKELFRWLCPIPFGVPKRVVKDDMYRGYRIPCGATVTENIWSICYDESVYPDPYTFNPERFLKDGKLDHSVKDPEGRIFGSGRRICPGRHFAVRTMFLNIACILAVFDIEAPAGEKLEAKFDSNFVRHPLPFECVIRPRSEERLGLVRDAFAAADDH